MKALYFLFHCHLQLKLSQLQCRNPKKSSSLRDCLQYFYVTFVILDCNISGLIFGIQILYETGSRTDYANKPKDIRSENSICCNWNPLFGFDLFLLSFSQKFNCKRSYCSKQ